ncbi:MAG: hypothetical protein ABFS42_02815 [Candidatus Krumholzibacteriota bacterium]
MKFRSSTWIKGILRDIADYLVRRPPVDTLIKFDTSAKREDYSQRIMQRLQIDVSLYSMLNVHQIGIQVPIRYVFDEILRWDGDSTCWPNHIAEVERQQEGLDHISIFLFGQRQYPFGRKHRFLGLRYIPLFNLTVSRLQRQVDGTETDNARFVLFRTTGGYPIGHFCMFTRSPIQALGETEMTQMFLMVGFDFYGRKSSRLSRLVSKGWEAVHNRVTANIMNRFKQFCELRFHRVGGGLE